MRLTHNVGFGDVVKYGLGKLGIHQKPGCPCPRRQAALNRWTPGYREAEVQRNERIAVRALLSLSDGPVRTGKGNRSHRSVRVSYPGKPLRGWFPFSSYAHAAISGGSPCNHQLDLANFPTAASINAFIDGGSVSNGETVCLAADTWSWTGQVSIAGKFIALQGAGRTLTHVTDNFTGQMLTINEHTGGSTRIEGIEFITGSGPGTYPNVMVAVFETTNGKPILIINNRMEMFTRVSDSMMHWASNKGVVAGNEFEGQPTGNNCFNSGAVMRMHVSSGSWTSPAAFQDTTGDRNIYIEDNNVLNVWQAFDGDDLGSRYVARFNTLHNSHLGLHGDSSTTGGRYIIAHNNNFVSDSTLWPQCTPSPKQANFINFISTRAGTTLLYNNTIPNINHAPNWAGSTEVRYNQWNLLNDVGPFPCWGAAHGYPGGYPAPYQNGWGWVTGTVEAVGTGKFFDRQPHYSWLNTGAGNYLNPDIGDYPNATTCGPSPAASNYVQAEREYYVHSTATGSPQTVGVRSGLLGARPASCTDYVAYWATDTNTLYQCHPANSWSVYYQPFTYPHPLVAGTPSIPPAAPTNLIVK